MDQLSRKMNPPDGGSESGSAGAVYAYWENWLNTIPRFREFETYLQTKWLEPSLTEGIKKALKTLVNRLKRRFDEVDHMTMSEVMDVLDSPDPPPFETLAPGPAVIPEGLYHLPD